MTIRPVTEADIPHLVRPLLDDFYGGSGHYDFSDDRIREVIADPYCRLMTDGTNLGWVRVIPERELVLIQWGFPTCSSASSDTGCREAQFRLLGTCFLELGAAYPEIRSYRWAADLAGNQEEKAEWWRAHVQSIDADVIDDVDYGRSVGGNMGDALDALAAIIHAVMRWFGLSDADP